MAKEKNPPASEWTPAIQDGYAGQGGSFIYDQETGTRRPATPDVADVIPKPFMPEEQPKAED